MLHRALPPDAVIAGMEAALAVGSLDPDVVTIEARRAAEAAARRRRAHRDACPASTGPARASTATTSSLEGQRMTTR